ncbi:YfbR-like 5'-deoxynucleotidase [Asticcacaulis biprosthecium]|nr:HD family hydrolase [Asticcacaulis biprosthecium]
MAVRQRKIARSPSRDTAPRAWQRMLSGRRLDLLDPHAIDIEIDDIALGLSRVARWNGQTLGEHGFSVAQHSLIVEDICGHIDPNITVPHRLMALLHDAPEYVIGDMISPFKAALGLDYKRFEAHLEQAIHVRFGLPALMPAAVKKLIKQADHACAYFEATQLAGFSDTEARQYFGEPPDGYILRLEPLPSKAASEAFVARFDTLIRQMKA